MRFNVVSKSSSWVMPQLAPIRWEKLEKIDVEKIITPELISVVIPVKNNQKGIDRLLQSIVENVSTEHYPCEVIIVDNNSSIELRIDDVYPFKVNLHRCNSVGPAAARNVGVNNASGAWILFTDSDCVFTGTTIAGYINYDNRCVAYAGAILMEGSDYLTRYYRDQNSFHPMSALDPESGEFEIATVVTANCLVLKSALKYIGGFNESFKIAGGEDTDLGFRLKLVGTLRFNPSSEALHEFNDGLSGFIKRYIRYGKGNRVLQDLYDVDFWPRHFFPNNQKVINLVLARISVFAMRWGFKRVS
jgi:glycosyltransferase involved in cell wall biosynthesis